MNHYVTLFNSVYLRQGIALYKSMERNIKEFKLWIICLDTETYDSLSFLGFSNVELLNLEDFETEQLKALKLERSVAEYCWTLTPFAPKFVFQTDLSISQVTYIDADLWFLADPAPMFEEFEASGKSVFITKHAFSPEHDQSKLAGMFCVQFLTFKRDEGEHVRVDWEKKCVDWCYARYEDNKFGDQKYLDSWPIQFHEDVHILQDVEKTQAPWNMQKFSVSECVFFHFHGLKIINHYFCDCGPYKIPKPTFDQCYKPYLIELRKIDELLITAGFEVKYLGLLDTATYFFKRWIYLLVQFLKLKSISGIIRWKW